MSFASTSIPSQHFLKPSLHVAELGILTGTNLSGMAFKHLRLLFTYVQPLHHDPPSSGPFLGNKKLT